MKRQIKHLLGKNACASNKTSTWKIDSIKYYVYD